ncbi:RmlC-like cupin domain-containing protein [Truncatella angustata]|uniref:Cysteine dioxygenase n=1 Tax=Truncatella angustata TaxID=152316 RepID=A0A9P8UJ47_9PEZI|nr:RmlC-like cupin domain-containing protein [Truncatella angustata]KAH6653142.1 RmlC-like cupin domain-containing protein [Truncatella angustata]
MQASNRRPTFSHLLLHIGPLFQSEFQQASKMSSVLALTQSPLSANFPSTDWAHAERYSLADVIRDIKKHLGSSSGIDSNDVDEEYLKALLQRYHSSRSDWSTYFYNDKSKAYTRNAVENVNRKANILLLVWNPGKGSPIHDHANAHCIMKVLAGRLTETVYYPQGNQSSETAPLRAKSVSTYGPNEVTYISDQIGLHRVSNPSSDEVAVSLHLYTPPNAAEYGYHIFNAETGKASFVHQARAHAATN